MSSLVSCLLLGLFTLVHSDVVGSQDDDVSPKLSWLTETRMELKIGGKRRNIWLTPTTNIPGLNTPCLFKGTLEGDPDSEVAVSGCHYNKETSVSIASSVLPDDIADLMIVDGITRNVESPSMNYSTSDVILPPPESAGDYFYHFWNGWTRPLPSRVVLRTNIKYDNSLLAHFGYSHRKTKAWIDRVVQLTKPKMYDYTLSIRVALEIGEISHTDETLKATEENMYHLHLKNHNVLTSYFCKDLLNVLGPEEQTIGMAFIGGACCPSACSRPGSPVNIVELYTTIDPDQNMAKNFAHELGHNIGMEHDFDPKHGGEWGRCNNQGLMSYGHPPSKWSSCSDADFKSWWRNEGHTCVKPI